MSEEAVMVASGSRASGTIVSIISDAPLPLALVVCMLPVDSMRMAGTRIAIAKTMALRRLRDFMVDHGLAEEGTAFMCCASDTRSRGSDRDERQLR